MLSAVYAVGFTYFILLIMWLFYKIGRRNDKK